MSIATRDDARMDGQHRLWLDRVSPLTIDVGDPANTRRITWVMCNPSTADGTEDDPTLRKVKGFTQRIAGGDLWRLRVVNLWTYRATYPRQLTDVAELNHPAADTALREAIDWADTVIVAWGGVARSVPSYDERVDEVWSMLYRLGPMCLGTTADGDPRHPLMLSYDTELLGWFPPAAFRSVMDSLTPERSRE
ncbi:MAG: DUF1643 domain-containing protein [Actinomycetota bacterium]